MTSCSESAKLADVMTTDPESDDESVTSNPVSLSAHTPAAARSLCFELTSTIVCDFCCVLTVIIHSSSNFTSNFTVDLSTDNILD